MKILHQIFVLKKNLGFGLFWVFVSPASCQITKTNFVKKKNMLIYSYVCIALFTLFDSFQFWNVPLRNFQNNIAHVIAPSVAEFNLYRCLWNETFLEHYIFSEMCFTQTLKNIHHGIHLGFKIFYTNICINIFFYY